LKRIKPIAILDLMELTGMKLTSVTQIVDYGLCSYFAEEG